MPPSTQSSQSAYHTLPRPQHDSHHLKAQPSQSQRPPLNRTPTPLPKFMPMPHGHSLRHPKSASPLTISTTSLSTKDRRIDKGKGVEVASTPVAFPSTVDAVASVAPISPHTIRARMLSTQQQQPPPSSFPQSMRLRAKTGVVDKMLGKLPRGMLHGDIPITRISNGEYSAEPSSSGFLKLDSLSSASDLPKRDHLTSERRAGRQDMNMRTASRSTPHLPLPEIPSRYQQRSSPKLDSELKPLPILPPLPSNISTSTSRAPRPSFGYAAPIPHASSTSRNSPLAPISLSDQPVQDRLRTKSEVRGNARMKMVVQNPDPETASESHSDVDTRRHLPLTNSKSKSYSHLPDSSSGILDRSVSTNPKTTNERSLDKGKKTLRILMAEKKAARKAAENPALKEMQKIVAEEDRERRGAEERRRKQSMGKIGSRVWAEAEAEALDELLCVTRVITPQRLHGDEVLLGDVLQGKAANIAAYKRRIEEMQRTTDAANASSEMPSRSALKLSPITKKGLAPKSVPQRFVVVKKRMPEGPPPPVPFPSSSQRSQTSKTASVDTSSGMGKRPEEQRRPATQSLRAIPMVVNHPPLESSQWITDVYGTKVYNKAYVPPPPPPPTVLTEEPGEIVAELNRLEEESNTKRDQDKLHSRMVTMDLKDLKKYSSTSNLLERRPNFAKPLLDRPMYKEALPRSSIDTQGDSGSSTGHTQESSASSTPLVWKSVKEIKSGRFKQTMKGIWRMKI